MALTLYRGLTTKDYNWLYSQDVIWLSTSKEHAQMYAEGIGKVFTFKVSSPLNYLDLQFVNSEVDVNLKDITDRLKSAILEKFEAKKLNRNKTLNLFDEANAIRPVPRMMPVWEWMKNGEILKVIKNAGFNSIYQREGLVRYAGNVSTYGILNKNLLKLIDES